MHHLARILFAAGTVSLAAPASAQNLLDGPLSRVPCFTRTYDAAHLRAHPRQTVRHFQVSRADDDPLAGSHPARFSLRFQFQVKGADDLYAGMAECRLRGATAACQVEGDGGAFTVDADGNGVRVTLGDRLEIEGETGFSPNLARGDNRVMVLRAGNVNACAG